MKKWAYLVLGVVLGISLLLMLSNCKKESDSNTPPTATFTVNPASGTIATEFSFNAGASSDKEDAVTDLQVRWDWESDGNWDTPFSLQKETTRKFTQAGTYNVKLEVKDKGSLSAQTSKPIVVTGAGTVMNQPCPGLPNFTYEGQTYNTVLIGTQCWMKENLNVGTQIIGSEGQKDNQILEKYCYDNDAANCAVYGGLYQWNEMMQYVTTSGAQGICPDGWHVPTDGEWCTMTTYIDPSVDCESLTWNGTDIAKKLKEAGFVHWNAPNTGANNQSGFSAFGGGLRFTSSTSDHFSDFKDFGYFWTSDRIAYQNSICRSLFTDNATIGRYSVSRSWGASIRCLKDN